MLKKANRICRLLISIFLFFVTLPSFAIIGTALKFIEEQEERNHVNHIRDNYPYLYNVIVQNSPISHAYQDICVKGLLCVSGLANFDLIYTDREGVPFANTGANLVGVGVRPLFGINSNNVVGSIDNINLIFDVGVKNWAYGHFDFAYVNGNRRVKTYAHKEPDWGSIYRSAAAVKVNQGYILFSRPDLFPVYFQIGRINSPFGDYTPFNMTPSLPQLLAQSRTGGIVIGVALENGLYGSLQWSMAQESSENINGAEQGGVLVGNNRDRNYGAKLGYQSCLSEDLSVHVNTAYIADIRDSDYLLEGGYLFNIAIRDQQDNTDFVFRNTWVRMTRAEGLSFHADFDYRGLGLSFDYVAALQNINDDTTIDSKIKAYDLTGHARFTLFGFESQFRASYQWAEDAQVYFTFVNIVNDLGPPPFFPAQAGNILPSHRYQLDYEFVLSRSISITAQWVLDYDFGEEHDGTGKKSTIAMLRLHAEF